MTQEDFPHVDSAAKEDDGSSHENICSGIKIPRDSYTAIRLYNSKPEIMDQESRVLIVGPVPVEWIRKNRELWGKKRFKTVRKMLPSATRVTKFLRRKQEMSLIEQLNNDAMNMMDLSPTTTRGSDVEFDGEDGEEDDQEDDDDEDEDEDLPINLLDRLELQEKANSAEAGGGENSFTGDLNGDSVLSAPSALQPAMPFSIASPSGLLETDLDPLNASPTEEAPKDECDRFSRESDPLAAQNFRNNDMATQELTATGNPRPRFNESSSYVSSVSFGGDSFVTADQDFSSVDQSITGGEAKVSYSGGSAEDELRENYQGDSIETPETTSQGEAVDLPSDDYSNRQEILPGSDKFENESDSASSTSTIKPTRRRSRAAKKMVKFPVNVVGGALEVGEKTADYAYNRAYRNALNSVSRNSKKLKHKGTHLISAKKLLRRKKFGEVVRLEKLLVTVRHSTATYLPPDFNETEQHDGTARLVQGWREYIVVARNSVNKTTGDPSIRLQFYTARNVSKVESQTTRPKSKLDIELNGSDFHVNFYSSLDKTIALWKSTSKGTQIYLFHARSRLAALSWLAFFAGVIGVRRGAVLHLKVPDLGVSVDIPFPISLRKKILDSTPDPLVPLSELMSASATPSRLVKFIHEKSLQRLREVHDLGHIMEKHWADNHAKLGLDWRRYDRLEWVFDINESQFHSAWAMFKTHDLELRPKTSYTRDVVFEDGAEMSEPTPIEGFLVRLTTWSGQDQHKKVFYKRTYLHTHDNLLFFCKAMKALPPQPAGGETVDLTNSTELDRLIDSMPIMYEVAPYEVNEATGQISWMEEGLSQEGFEEYNRQALFEMQRRVASIQRSEGFIDLVELSEVNAIDEYDDVEDVYNELVQDGTLFEIVMEQSGLRLKLRAHDRITRDQWVTSLSELMRYWKRRIREDTKRTNAVRRTNLKTMQIDDDMDAFVGEAVPKWVTARGIADPLTYNTSGISWSRSIHIKGFLYQKPSKFATFSNYYCVLCQGSLILYSPYNRDPKGNVLPRVSYEKYQTIELKDCYIYSGMITSMDLMNRDKWFDKNNPGKHSLPRVYSDGWKSAEEETMRCFVLWFGRKRVKAQGKSNEEVEEPQISSLKLVNRLGVRGIPMVFVARSRQERDMWVNALAIEIGRVAETANQDIQLV